MKNQRKTTCIRASKQSQAHLLGSKQKALLASIALSLFSLVAIGQLKIDGFSINPKAGAFNSSDGSGLVAGTEFSILKNHRIYSIEYLTYNELLFFGPSPNEYYNQIDLMVGKYIGDKNFRLQYQTGLATLWGIKRTQKIEDKRGILGGSRWESTHFFTPGIVTKLGLKVIPVHFLSIGLDLQANMNLDRPTFMPMLSLELGNLRPRMDR